jgi:hypothetical protein
VTTIQQLEGEDWGDPPPGSTSLVGRCTELRRKPLDQFTVEDLRIMLGQEMAVPILLPLAIEALVDDPLAEGDFYPGDLLVSVLRLPDSAWTTIPEGRQRLFAAVAALELDMNEADLPRNVRNAVAAAHADSTTPVGWIITCMST